MNDLFAALCLMVVIEGLVLFAMPESWRKTVIALIQLPTPLLRRMGAVVMVIGLASLWLLRRFVA